MPCQRTISTLFFFFISLYPLLSHSEPSVTTQTPLGGITPRIVGGDPSVPGAWPWMAALVEAHASDYYTGQYCGAALIDPAWVMTAAHCVYDQYKTSWRKADSINVVLGLHNLRTDAGEEFAIKRIVGHPEFNRVTLSNDIALLELESKSTATPLTLFTDDTKDLAGAMATIIGWGDTSADFTSSYPEELQEVEVPIVTDEVCETAHPGKITENMICSGFAEGGKDSCFGDSGGPLMIHDGEQWLHAGIISWGTGCAQPESYGVYTRISKFINFITEYKDPAPMISVSPAAINFKYTQVHSTSSKTLTVYNQGQENLIVSTVFVQGDEDNYFSINDQTCTAEEVLPDASCTITILFSPQSDGSFDGNLRIGSNDSQVTDKSIPLHGNTNFPLLYYIQAIIRHQNLPER